jgi:Short-chain dehydrogenases of various substrate specificities
MVLTSCLCFSQNGVVILQVEGIDLKKGGELSAGIFKEENFPKVGKQLLGTEVAVTGSKMEIRISNVPAGWYGVAVFQDIDKNKNLKTNFIGLPQEPIGFSNDARIKFGPPDFEDARFIGAKRQRDHSKNNSTLNYNKMKELILITGASSGIGYEMARLLAAKGYDLVLVARRLEKLEVLKSELEKSYSIKVYPIQKDLSEVAHAAQLYDEIKQRKLEVTMLVNNAGRGAYGNFSDTDLEMEMKMIELNVLSLVCLTKLFLQDMLIRKKGRIMNVASLLSFLPFPYYTVYSATKAFVLSFSETLAAELEGTGVVVTALCPGPVDTAFNTDEMWKTNAYKANQPVNPEFVANQGVELLLNGTGKKVVGFNNWFISNLPRITPDGIMMKIKKNLASQRN